MLIKKNLTPPTDAPTFNPPAAFEEVGPAVSMPLSPSAIPRQPTGGMTRRKRVRLRKRYNKLRRLARIGKVQLVVRSYMHGTYVLNEQE